MGDDVLVTGRDLAPCLICRIASQHFLVAGTTARCLTTSIRTFLTEFVSFRTSAFARILPSCSFARRLFVWVVNSGHTKTIHGVFKNMFSSNKKNQPWLISLSCLHSALSGPSGKQFLKLNPVRYHPHLTCEPTCTRPKLSPAKTWKLKNAETET